MLKPFFFEFLNSLLLNLSYEEKIHILNKIKATWIDEYFEQYITNELFCPKCNKFLPLSTFKELTEKEVKKAYYNEEEFEAIYTTKYKICPNCKSKLDGTVIDIKITNSN